MRPHLDKNQTIFRKIRKPLFCFCLQNGEVTVGARDGAAHVLRCLKVWYDLPSDVLFVAINFVDRFLTKMRVRPKHMACISVGSFLLALRQLKMNFHDIEDIVSISQVNNIFYCVDLDTNILILHLNKPNYLKRKIKTKFF